MGMSDTQRTDAPDRLENTYPQDDLFVQLSHPRRRHILATLAAVGPDEEVACGQFVDASQTPQQSSVELYHVHLPKLAYSDYVDWDPGDETVTRGSDFDAVLPAIELLYHHRDRLPGSWA